MFFCVQNTQLILINLCIFLIYMLTMVVTTLTYNADTKQYGVYSFHGSDWYVSHDGNKSYEQVTRANLDDNYFAEITVKDTYTNNKMANGTYEKKTDTTGLSDKQTGWLAAITSFEYSPEKDEATIVVTSSIGDQTVYDGVCSSFDDVCEKYPELRKTSLLGFAVNETGKLPKIYTLRETGFELQKLEYDVETGAAKLNYKEFIADDQISFVLFVAAYDSQGNLLGKSLSETLTIDCANEADGYKEKTFTANFGELDLTKAYKYKVFMFDGITTTVPLFKSITVSNPAYVAQ